MTASANALPDFAVIDPHIHQWNPISTPRATTRAAQILRFAPALERPLMMAFPVSDRQFIGDPSYVVRPYLPENYAADARPLTVSAVVHIEAGWHGRDHLASVDETRWVAGLPFNGTTRPRLGAIVVHADPTNPDIGRVLDAHRAASDLVRGVRFIATNHPDPRVKGWTTNPHLLTSSEFLTGFAAIADRGLSFELWVYSHQLPDATALASEFPETTFVLNHYATPVGLFGPRGRQTGQTASQRADILRRWQDDVAALAAQPNVVAKQSGMGMPLLGVPAGVEGPAASRAELTDLVGPLVTHTQDLFGPDRTMWASNYPIDKPTVELPDSIAILSDLLGDQLDPVKMFRDNAARVYSIAP